MTHGKLFVGQYTRNSCAAFVIFKRKKRFEMVSEYTVRLYTLAFQLDIDRAFLLCV